MIARASIRLWFATIASLAMLVAVPSRAQQSYQLTDLGSLGGVRGSGAYAHRGGVSVGYSFVAGSSFVHAMLNDRGTVVDLGTLGGTQSLARAVNVHGQVVGWAYLPGLAWQRAFLWQDGVMTDLGTFGGNVSDALDLNDAGMVVGSSYDLQGRERAFWWQGGALQDLGTLGGSQSRASGINQWGDITGMAQIPGDDEFHAFLGKPGSPLYDLGTLGGPASHAHDINNNVHVCGWSMIEPNNPASRGFVWADGIMKSVGTLGGIYSAAFGLNDLDQVVGASTRADGTQAAFLWQGDQIVDLNTLLPPGTGWFLSSASDIDNLGAIVGEGVNPQGRTRAFLLTPTATTGVPPAPSRLSFAGAWPNPVRSATQFRFELPAAGPVTLELFDLSGRLVRTLSERSLGAGPERLAWDGRDESGARAGAGAYFARLRTSSGQMTRRFVVLP